VLRQTIEVLDAASTAAGDRSTFHRYWSADERFHTAIAAQSGNPFLAKAYASLGGQVQRFRLFAELGSSDAGHAAAEHRRIYDALDAGDAARAADLMRQHVGNAGARALKDRRDVATPRPR
jgi:DNA-binding GntR family transcriptional regulator